MPRAAPDPALRRRHLWLAGAGFAAFLLHVALKAETRTLPEVLWGCNVTALLLVAGFALESPLAVGTAFLWRAALGDPGFLAGLWSGSPYPWTTAFVHVVPTVLAVPYLRRTGLPRQSPFVGMGLTLALVAAGRAFTPPEMNINFAHARIPQLAALFPAVWSYRVAASLLVIGVMLGADQISAAFFGRPGFSRRSAASR